MSKPVATLPTLYWMARLLPAAEPLKQPNHSFNSRVAIWKGNITKLSIPCIVNAAKPSLLGGGGVDGAIHEAAGPDLREECLAIQGPDPNDPDRRCDQGDAKLTGGHLLTAKHIIHTVGPIYKNSRESEPILRSCYSNILKLAVENGIDQVALCGISTGIYGYPSKEAARVACETVRDFMEGPEGSKIRLIVFVTFVQNDVDAYNDMVPKFFPPSEGELPAQ